jgi:hypothetical protein
MNPQTIMSAVEAVNGISRPFAAAPSLVGRPYRPPSLRYFFPTTVNATAG